MTSRERVKIHVHADTFLMSLHVEPDADFIMDFMAQGQKVLDLRLQLQGSSVC